MSLACSLCPKPGVESAKGPKRTLWLCAEHYVRWVTATAALAAERAGSSSSGAELAPKLAMLAARAAESKIAGWRPKPGTQAALATLGKEHEPQRSRRRP